MACSPPQKPRIARVALLQGRLLLAEEDVEIAKVRGSRNNYNDALPHGTDETYWRLLNAARDRYGRLTVA